MVDTAKVTGRRTLQLNSLDEILAEVERLASSSRIEALGNWTLAQAIAHLARSMDISIDGVNFRVQWYIRLVGPLMKKRILNKPMPAGFQLRGDAAKTLMPESAASLAQAVLHFRQATARVQQEAHREPHAIFGAFTREEWDRFHARHAEMHLSFFVPLE